MSFNFLLFTHYFLPIQKVLQKTGTSVASFFRSVPPLSSVSAKTPEKSCKKVAKVDVRIWAGGDRTLVVGRKDGTDPRSAASNTAVNLLLFLLNFLYDRVGWHVNCEGVSWLCSIIIKC